MPGPEDVVFATADGGPPIACWRQGDGDPILLVHGSGEDHARWGRIGPALADRFAVHAMDRRGHGRSGDAPHHSLAAEARDIAAVVREIGRPAHLFGHSYGALCCLEAAAAGADVAGLVLHEPCLPIAGAPTPSAVAERLRALLEAGDREEVVLTFFREVVEAPTRYTRILRALPAFPGMVRSAHTLVRELAATEGYAFDAERFRGLDVDVLLLAGNEPSSRHVAAAVAAIRDAVPGTRVAALSAQPHMALDMVPDRVSAAVAGFLGSQVHPVRQKLQEA